MKRKVYKIISFVCSLILFFNLQVYSFASTSSGSDYYNWTAGEKFAYFLLNGMNILGDGYSMVIGADDADDVWQDFFDFVSQEYLEENQTFDEWCLSNTSWYYDNSGIQNENTVTGFSMTPTMADALQLTVNNYVASNPLSYKVATIPSYTRLNTSQFSNYTVYSSVKEIIKNCGGYAFLSAPNGWGRTNDVAILVTVPRSTYPINFYGTVTGGVFTNVQLEHNWANIQNFYPSDSTGVKLYMFKANQAPVQYTSWNNTMLGSYVAGYQTVINTPSIFSGTNKAHILTNLSKDEEVYVFDNINAYKNYNSGAPQPYYLGTDFGSHKTKYDVSDFPSGNNSYYNQVINNVQSGWTAEEVITLVDKIIQNGGSSSSSESDKDTSKWWERIGNAIGNLIDGIVDVLTKVIEKLSDALLSIIHLLTGYTDDSGVYHVGLFDKLTNLVDSGFSSFISSMFSWLPEEIITLLTAMMVFGIFFGIFKMLRR